MWKKTLCRGVVCLVFLMAGVATLSLSFWAAISLHEPWGAADYWFAWFAGISFILGFVVLIMGGVATCIFLSEVCGNP